MFYNINENKIEDFTTRVPLAKLFKYHRVSKIYRQELSELLCRQKKLFWMIHCEYWEQFVSLVDSTLILKKSYGKQLNLQFAKYKNFHQWLINRTPSETKFPENELEKKWKECLLLLLCILFGCSTKWASKIQYLKFLPPSGKVNLKKKHSGVLLWKALPKPGGNTFLAISNSIRVTTLNKSLYPNLVGSLSKDDQFFVLMAGYLEGLRGKTVIVKKKDFPVVKHVVLEALKVTIFLRFTHISVFCKRCWHYWYIDSWIWTHEKSCSQIQVKRINKKRSRITIAKNRSQLELGTISGTFHWIYKFWKTHFWTKFELFIIFNLFLQSKTLILWNSTKNSTLTLPKSWI